MFFSFQREFKEDLDNIVKQINDWDGSSKRLRLLECMAYRTGGNTFINNFTRWIWSDEAKKMVENVYAPNYKTAYGFYGNMVSQKNNALYGEMPSVDGFEKEDRKELGFSLKSAGDDASTYGYSVIYERFDGTYKVLDTPNCLVFIDDKTKEIRRVVRYWYNDVNDISWLYFEVYDEIGIITYAKSSKTKDIEVFIEKQPYKKLINTSSLGTEENVVALRRLPIVIYHNNDKDLPDLAPNIKQKIDLIDVIQSGYANNIEEFSDVWMSINVPSATSEQVAQIKETARRTKTILFAGTDEKNNVDFKTMQIPYEARAKAVEMLKQELVEDTGVIDFKAISGSATATEINARTYKLQQRVSDFEWYSDKCATELVEIWQDYHDEEFEIDITFNKLFIKNNTEIINNANAVYGKISTRSYLGQLQLAGVIDDVDEEMAELDRESIGKFDFGGLDGQSAQTNGQDINNNEQDNETDIS